MTQCSKMSIPSYLFFCKIDYPQLPKLCVSWRPDFIFNLVYLQEYLSDLSGRNVKLQVHE